MTSWAIWTWIAIGLLVTLPVIVLVLFLRDAFRMLREFGKESDH